MKYVHIKTLIGLGICGILLLLILFAVAKKPFLSLYHGQLSGETSLDEKKDTQPNVAMEKEITATLSGTVFRDDNCNETKDPGENGLIGAIVSIIRSSDNELVFDMATDEKGRYVYTKLLKKDEAHGIRPSVTSLEGYQSHPTFNPTFGTTVLDKTHTNVTVDIPQIPYDALPQC